MKIFMSMDILTFEQIGKIVREGIKAIDFKKQPERLYDPIDYIISVGGKRIRPQLAVLTWSLFAKGQKPDMSVLAPAFGLEVFHAFTLIHDDIMDKADMRRGHPTIHKKWNDNIAILSGDVMCIKAYEFMCKAAPDRLPAVLELFNDTAAKVCEGQQFDMDYETMPVVTMDDYIRMIGLKTAVFIACAAKLGVVLAGADAKYADALYRYGYLLGLAFQITDDYLDSFGDPAVFGKNIGGDIVNNKKTWLYISAENTAKGADKARFAEIMSMGEERTEEKIRAAKEFYTLLGIKEMAEKAIDSYYSQAIETAAGLELGADATALLEEYAATITYRKK